MSKSPQGFGFFVRTNRVPAWVCGYCFSSQPLLSEPFLRSNSTPLLPPYQAMASSTGALRSPKMIHRSGVGRVRRARAAGVLPLRLRRQAKREPTLTLLKAR